MSLKEYKDFVDDCSVSCLPETGNIKSLHNGFLTKKNPFGYNENILEFAEGVAIPFWDGEKWRQIVNKEKFEFDPTKSLDVGAALEFANDYWVYICVDDGEPKIVVSKNMTYPNGSSENTSRRIGHFYYGTIRKVSDDGTWCPIDSAGNKFGSSGTKWQDNVTKGIIPNSLWDLSHKPKTEHPGLVEVCGLWMGMYQVSAEEKITYMNNQNGLHVTSGKLATKYGAKPVTGVDGAHLFVFNELARRQGLRLPVYSEWLMGAFGSPQGEAGNNNYAWSKTTNTASTFTGCEVNSNTGAHDMQSGVKPYAISAYNLCDCAGNVYEFTTDVFVALDGTQWASQNVLGNGLGLAFLSGKEAFNCCTCGGTYLTGTVSGSRSVRTYSAWWEVVGNVDGCRIVCDMA